MSSTLVNVPNQKILVSSLYSPELAEKLVSCLLILDNEQQSVAPRIYHHVVADSISSGFEVFWFR